MVLLFFILSVIYQLLPLTIIKSHLENSCCPPVPVVADQCLCYLIISPSDL